MKNRQNIIIFTALAALLFWISDAAVGALVFRRGVFTDLVLFGASSYELYLRTLGVIGIASCGFIISGIFCKHSIACKAQRAAEDELRTHREQLGKLVADRTRELHAVNELLRKEIRDRAWTQEELSRSESFLSAIFDSFHDPMSIMDREFRIIKFNDAYARMRGKQAPELFDKKCYNALWNRDGVCGECIVDRTFQSKDPCAKEKQLTLPDGSPSWIEICTYPICDQSGTVTHVVECAWDITERKKEEEEKKNLIKRLNHLSTTDGLTGLLNRRALNDMLQHEIDRANRYNADLSLILCDVDRFKGINDSYGHTAGDQVLQAVSEALKGALRKADILGRYGGDEFMVILPETGLDGARSLAEKIRIAVNDLGLVLPWNERSGLSISIGVARCCTPVDNIDTLIALADSALYFSKEGGRNRVAVMKK